jgi:hypothetical protein
MYFSLKFHLRVSQTASSLVAYRIVNGYIKTHPRGHSRIFSIMGIQFDNQPSATPMFSEYELDFPNASLELSLGL